MAGLIGYGLAWVQISASPTFPADTVAAENDVAADDVQTQLDQIRADIDAMPAADTSNLETAIADLQSGLTDLQTQFSELPTAVTDPATPIIGEDAQAEAVQVLSQQIANQTAELQAQRDELQAELDTIRDEAESIRNDAIEGARTETAKAALARVQGAIESGAPMTTALNDLQNALDASIPDALTAVAQDGVPTMESLREAYPEAARLALDAARTSGEDGDDAGGLGAFLRTQMNVRSTAPREGNSADAILSRAEDALRNGRLNDALAELETLSEAPRAAMSDWIALADQRAAAVEAVNQLDTNLTAN
ncbi:hypothetical protein [Loktanella sp. SALINAS62]|uniref:COG4223 family protein n=1 Tax=Loktanella sp. SALINAS62 TaxID=2706124 RepID=UPI001B8C7663|nr:hypothetical protein [Loktanella sp. SALINAS62]MBS1302415.1 hypothetical protein [Loktanella sp. SALINAS62]